MATIMNLTPCRVCSEVYRGFFPKAGPKAIAERDFSRVDIRSIYEHQFKISNGPVTIIQEPQKRRRVFIESDDEEQGWFRLNCIFFYRHGGTAFAEHVWSTFLQELTFLTFGGWFLRMSMKILSSPPPV